MPPPSPRRNRKWLLLVVLAGVAVWGLYAEREREKAANQPSLLPFPEVVQQETRQGWRVAKEPDLPGPYRRVKQDPLIIGRGDRGRFFYRGKMYELPLRPDADQLAVPLETADGQVTFAVLER